MVQDSVIHVREAVIDDLRHTNNVVRVVNAAYHSEGGWTTAAHIVKGIRTDAKEIESLVRNNGSPDVLLYAFDGDMVVGTIVAKQVVNGESELSLLSVAPEYQSKGVGKKLIYAVYESMRRMGATKAVLEVLDVREELVAWYLKLGFAQVGDKTKFYWDDRLMLPNVRMITMKRKI
ncbi:acyl-CoA N-acyltransferase [Fennellomyces sp. T-0311]|nr:acyl-CoA N-acyltransferase [Fennellomyces sp. T-0311]